jgi:hypothetical protein
MSLIWRADNPHPALTGLRDYLVSRRVEAPEGETWEPKWGSKRGSNGTFALT